MNKQNSVSGGFASVILLVLFTWVGLVQTSSAQKNDTIYLLNGDRITGEIKKYENGQLKLSTEGMNIIYIELCSFLPVSYTHLTLPTKRIV